ncbi:MAG: UDP-N-acetylmuramoyl-L-alanyl-D-glutamate--2,6-diaminopimelate ligase, partial [Polaromonas sp.]|nr:UDP-N-acetylmuramoyl-L-alanyl-D-glutamate--2,6-diaminopimelate ligase [Polaromonas sp.]
DAGKRPLMAAAAAAGAAQLVLTSDNPRSEDPETIIADSAAGLPAASSAQIEPDRALAIALAVRQAAPQDIVLLAGKGHETSQDIGGIQSPFSDRAHAEAALAAYTTATRNAQPTGVRA